MRDLVEHSGNWGELSRYMKKSRRNPSLTGETKSPGGILYVNYKGRIGVIFGLEAHPMGHKPDSTLD